MRRTPVLLKSLPVAVAAACVLTVLMPGRADETGSPARPVKIVLVGDSTVTDASGWGRAFARRLAAGATCVNWAKSGRSSRSFRAEGHWAKALAEKPDYVLIQFGHNDQPGKGPERETGPGTTYREFLGGYVDETRAAGATPVLITPMTRRTLVGGRVAADGLADYAAAARAVAAAKTVPLVDLYSRSVAAVEALGPAAADALGPTAKDGKPDRTHLNDDGGRAMSRLVADGLRDAVPALAPYLRPDADGPAK